MLDKIRQDISSVGLQCFYVSFDDIFLLLGVIQRYHTQTQQRLCWPRIQQDLVTGQMTRLTWDSTRFGDLAKTRQVQKTQNIVRASLGE
jgi:hypothetical protein